MVTRLELLFPTSWQISQCMQMPAKTPVWSDRDIWGLLRWRQHGRGAKGIRHSPLAAFYRGSAFRTQRSYISRGATYWLQVFWKLAFKNSQHYWSFWHECCSVSSVVYNAVGVLCRLIAVCIATIKQSVSQSRKKFQVAWVGRITIQQAQQTTSRKDCWNNNRFNSRREKSTVNQPRYDVIKKSLWHMRSSNCKGWARLYDSLTTRRIIRVVAIRIGRGGGGGQ